MLFIGVFQSRGIDEGVSRTNKTEEEGEASTDAQ